MRHWTLSAAIGTAILSSSSASASPEQDVVSGIYVLDEERSENAFQAIDSAIAHLSNANRPFARMRLRKSIAVNRIRISILRNRLGIAYDAKKPIVVWLGEEPSKWKLQEGFDFDVSAKASGEAIYLTFRSDDSKRTTTYRSVGQNLVEETTIDIPLLAKPIIYKQFFKRTN